MTTTCQRWLVLISLVGTLGACSTIVSGTAQTLHVHTPQVVGASCDINDSRQGYWYVPRTPGSVVIARGDGPLTVVCQRAGYETTEVVVPENLAFTTFGNVILGGLVGILVDSASGAAQHYPDTVTVWMKPNRFPDAAAEAHWQADKAAFEEAARKRQAAKATAEEHSGE